MIDIFQFIGTVDKLTKVFKFLYKSYKKNPSSYLSGSLSDGIDLSYRIIALFEAHNCKRTQIHHFLRDQFPNISPTLNADSLHDQLSTELIEIVSGLFGVRQSWLEGEDGPIYELLHHYKDIGSLTDFLKNLKHSENSPHHFLTAYKDENSSNDFYLSLPDISLVYSVPLKEIGEKTIYRHMPIYGPYPWRDDIPRYHLAAYFNIADNTSGIFVKGFSASQSQVQKLGGGYLIPDLIKARGIWHPADYGYPAGSNNIGKLKPEDWKETQNYFGQAIELNTQLSLNIPKYNPTSL